MTPFNLPEQLHQLAARLQQLAEQTERQPYYDYLLYEGIACYYLFDCHAKNHVVLPHNHQLILGALNHPLKWFTDRTTIKSGYPADGTLIGAIAPAQGKSRRAITLWPDSVGDDTLTALNLIPSDPLDVPARIRELREIRDGWYDASSKAPPHSDLDWLESSYQNHFPAALPRPYLFPTPEGNVEAEWSLGENSVILKFCLADRQGEWFRFSKTDDTNEESQTLDLNDANDWQWFAREIGRLADAAAPE